MPHLAPPPDPSQDDDRLSSAIFRIFRSAEEDALPGSELPDLTDLGRARGPRRPRDARSRDRNTHRRKGLPLTHRHFPSRGRGLASDRTLVTEHHATKEHELTRSEPGAR
jgi:hypothetical protein